MKEKTKKGFFGFFQNARSSAESSEKSVITAAASPEESKNEDLKEAASDSTEQKGSAAVTAPPETEQKAPSLSSIWEQSDDPLIVRIDEEALYSECAQFSSKMNSLSNVFKRTAENTQEPEPQPKAAQAHLYISHDRMAAWIYVIPPFNGGEGIKEEDLKSLLNQERITKGIIEDALKSIVEEQIYDQSVLIAKGVLARNGIDGSIKDHFKRTLNLEFKEDENGSVDYKKLNNIQSVKEGEVISTITLAVPGENGMTITGHPYPCVIKGTNVPIPSGRNTSLTEDRTLLISRRTGHVTFANGKFQVDPLLKINGNIDNSTGNLDYDGDIFITGDVRNGFSVKATGRIDIRGSVEGAQITAQGAITIASGMSGNGRGVLTSDSDIKCRYLEHCTVSAKGNVYAESIINSKIESGQDIIVTSGMGVIIGGSLLASNSINARIIGSKVRRLITELIIANIPKNVEESSRLTREMEQLRHNMSEVRKNITYLETTQRQDKQLLLDSLKQASAYLNLREQEITNRLNEITATDREQSGIIQCQQLLPVVRIKIGSSSLLVQEEYSRSIIYKNNEGEITIGSN
ncbi:MAG: DUF342 domain-containing protein [Lacrimispora celerecrescens]|uniref:DUF342 domain-containing protein n=1 Tax=Lacrimispora indolis TaxID=69825 RepID=UPI0003F8A98D|nr:FapA family protein [[Clostridium] methoxybenzovorans]MBE7720290.1 DUF342 domain-containing protein [Lacrimispora celerecrescens]